MNLPNDRSLSRQTLYLKWLNLRHIQRAACFLVCCLPLSAFTHEVWIEPVEYTLTAKTDLIADVKIGQNFKGSPQYYIAENTLSAGVLAPSETVPLDRISGDIPAIKANLTRDGLHVAWMHTRPDKLHYKTFEKFKDFVTQQGLSEIAQQHIDRAWPNANFFEAYSRCSKSLIQVGDAQAVQGLDKALGMPIELIAQSNPYQLRSGDQLPVKLLWDSKIMVDSQVMIFHKTAAKDVKISTVQTDTSGIAMIEVNPGDYLLNAVHIIPWEGEPQALWHSYWASLTFRIND